MGIMEKKANHQANIVRVTEIKVHTNADSLEIIPIGEFQVVSRKDQFHVGDLAVYIQPDSIVPQTEPFRFIWEPYMCIPSVENPACEEGFAVPEKRRRITVRKFRGEWSEGLLLPVGDFGLHDNGNGYCSFLETHYFKEGDDVSDFLNITHYDPDADKLSLKGETSAAPRLRKKYPQSLKGWAIYLWRRAKNVFNTRPDGGVQENVSLGIPTYDVDALKNYPGTFVDGEEVIVTEKVHGCVTNSTKIRMANGDRKFIRDVTEGDYVLGRNAFGQLVPSLVKKKYNNGKTDTWLKVTGKREGLGGRGSSFFAVNCTPEHQFWVEEKNAFVEAKNLETGNHVLTVRTDLDLTPLQSQVTLGKLLGDGSLTRHVGTATLHFGHKVEDKEYVEWTQKGLGQLSNHHTDIELSGYGTKMIRGSSLGSAFLKKEFSCFYESGEKQVPFWVEDSLTPIAIAFWYMDDGSLSHSEFQEDRATFATCGFNRKSCGHLVNGLQKLGIEASIQELDYRRIVLNSTNAEKLFLLVAPYIPPCMQRKLPERYRGGTGWLPKSTNSYKTTLVPVTVTSVENNLTVKSKKYDLETETHNYFANNILVHNSNARYIFLDGIMYAGSRNLWKSPTSSCIFRKNLKENPWIGEWCRAHEGYVLWGEVTPTQGGYDYGSKKPQFFVFDVRHPDGHWLSYDVLEEKDILMALRSHSVPVYYHDSYDLEHIKKFVDGPSMVPGAKTIREGVVIKTVPERHVRGVGRCQLKIVSNAFLEKDNK